MPLKPKRACRYPGCPELIRHGSYCEIHGKAASRLEGRPTAAERGYDHAWHKVRAQYIKHHPLCEYCGKRSTAEVHHLVPVKQGGSHKWDNLKAACRSCHKRNEGKG